MKRIPGDLRLALTESIEVTGMASRENEILLESGTNEVEILEFRIKENSFGINIARYVSCFSTVRYSRFHIPRIVWKASYAPGMRF